MYSIVVEILWGKQYNKSINNIKHKTFQNNFTPLKYILTVGIIN